ncbi:hypothetical protein V2I01_12140 [Micromonospora sp. BRA006-A]|nr:hypothetical protein [Micromonospora sp. BRA006-A]
MAAVGIGSYVKRNFPMRLLNRAGTDAGPWNVTGPLCTPNDTVGRNVELPELRPGDLVGVLRSGAYGPSASPVLFLSHGHPAEVLVDGGRARRSAAATPSRTCSARRSSTDNPSRPAYRRPAMTMASEAQSTAPRSSTT